ncbi:TIGR00366 family protein [Halosimplex salinum]|uniref:TIGR00366 family protein n=1 Tax=Halosimplex salinum TaxID=1710538 RepID=UPI0013DDA86C|nr:TIGR00366 family protein [Halosimplex salinum]
MSAPATSGSFVERLPLLAITEIKAREMFGYTIAMLLALVPFLAVVLYLLPY